MTSDRPDRLNIFGRKVAAPTVTVRLTTIRERPARVAVAIGQSGRRVPKAHASRSGTDGGWENTVAN